MSALEHNLPSEALRRLETIRFDAYLVQLTLSNQGGVSEMTF